MTFETTMTPQLYEGEIAGEFVRIHNTPNGWTVHKSPIDAKYVTPRIEKLCENGWFGVINPDRAETGYDLTFPTAEVAFNHVVKLLQP